jgi:predicted Fe-Mo cluster-binding NifX family protein
MKIAVTAKGAGLGAWLDADFDHCLQVVIVDEDNHFEAWMNPERESDQMDQFLMVEKLINEKVACVITGKISEIALKKLQNSGIQVYLAEKKSILELVEAVQNHELQPVN